MLVTGSRNGSKVKGQRRETRSRSIAISSESAGEASRWLRVRRVWRDEPSPCDVDTPSPLVSSRWENQVEDAGNGGASSPLNFESCTVR